MKILMIGDVVGSPGRRILKERLPQLRRELGLGAVVVNAENAAAGSGLTVALGNEILKMGVDAITLGDLIESRFKRECGVKDSATFMPAGMGGFLDMFDSILFIPALVYLPIFYWNVQ